MCEILPRLSTEVHFEVVWFQSETTYRKYKTCTGSADDLPTFQLLTIRPSHPKFLQWIQTFEIRPRCSIWGHKLEMK